MAQQVLAAKPDDLTLIPRTRMLKGKTYKLSADIGMYVVVYTSAHIHIHTYITTHIKCKKVIKKLKVEHYHMAQQSHSSVYKGHKISMFKRYFTLSFFCSPIQLPQIRKTPRYPLADTRIKKMSSSVQQDKKCHNLGLGIKLSKLSQEQKGGDHALTHPEH